MMVYDYACIGIAKLHLLSVIVTWAEDSSGTHPNVTNAFFILLISELLSLAETSSSRMAQMLEAGT